VSLWLLFLSIFHLGGTMNRSISRAIHRAIALCLIGLVCQTTSLPAQKTETKFELTIDNIMRGTEMIGTQPTQIRWSQDSRRVYFNWRQPGESRDKDPDLYVVNRDGSGLRKLTEEEARNAPPPSGDLSKDKKRSVFTDNGDLFIYDHERGERKQLTSTTDVESNPHFTQDQHHIYYTRGNNLYLLSLDDGTNIQMTDLRTQSAGRGQKEEAGEQKGTESQEYLKKEEKELLDAIKQRSKRREEQQARRKDMEKRKPFQLQPKQNLQALNLSPDGRYVIASINENSDGAKTTIVPNFVTESAYTEDIPTRTKVGDVQPRFKLAVLNTENGTVAWVDHGQKENSIQAQKTASSPDQQVKVEQVARERELSLFSPVWSEDGTKAVVAARAADNKDRWLLLLDPATGKSKPLVGIHDDAWIDGPGSNTMGWLPDNQQIYFQQERDGYAHLYTCPVSGGEPVQLTSGKFEVFSPQISDDGKKWYFTSSEENPGERQFYSMPAGGGARTKITSLPGSHQVTLSPDETMLVSIYSYSNKPPELYLQENRPGAEARQITTSPTADWLSYKWIDPPVVTFTARDGATVYGRLYKPAKFPKGGPAVIFVHGAGYLQNAHKYWSFYYREYMFHHYLIEHGYTVLDIDYRGSAGYGRDWRTGIYRYMGGKDLDDHVDAAKWLVAQHGVGPKRIGIYGGSYGGFITLMAMFTQPDVFAAGAALRPVTDWAHYNHPYTSNILNTPQKDPEAYKRSSPIYYAAGLKGALLICHGMVDQNVHFQDTVRLAQRLIELRKENWELAVYPVEDHGFVENTSWADEYRRIFKLFEINLKKK
jgi:dipeptidyl aminopeptidase/acylaminoacyl peptidase